MINTVRITVLVLTSMVFTYWANAQNFVPNPGFESIKKKPCFFLYYPPRDTATQNINIYLNDWYTPTGGTPDPWSYSDTINDTRCTQNLKGLGVSARTGQSCIGLYTGANKFRSPFLRPTYREYIQTQLKQPLRQGGIYYAELYVLRSPYSGSVTNNLGIYFSKQAIFLKETDWQHYGAVLPVSPQINQTQLITDAKKWQRISGCFIAQEDYEYITVGNFYDDNHTKLQAVFGLRDDYPYYLIDDVSVVEAGIDKIPVPFKAYSNTTLCGNQSLRLQLTESPTIIYHWQDGTVSPSYTVSQSGLYSVTATAGLCSVTDSIRVTIEPPVHLPADTVLCQGQTLTLAPDYPTKRGFQWSDGSRDSTLTVSQAGTYSVRVPSAFCNLTDTITVRYEDCPGVVPNVFTPNGDGKNDAFVIPNIQSRPWGLEVYNRWGKRVYRALPYANDWRAEDVPSGLYYYGLFNEDLKRTIKGWVNVIKDK